MNMKYKAYLCSFLLTFPILGKASAEADSLRQIQISRLQEQVNWVNPEAIRAYLDDTKSSLGDKATGLYQKLEELETLLPRVNRHLSEDTTRQTIAEAEKLLALKREIILANPLLDVDKILIARYRLGNKARKAMGPSLGTSVANYNSLFSSRRKGYDAEISQLSNLRGDIQSKTIYKPQAMDIFCFRIVGNEIGNDIVPMYARDAVITNITGGHHFAVRQIVGVAKFEVRFIDNYFLMQARSVCVYFIDLPLRKRFLFPEQYIRHETALQIQQPFCRYHLRPSRNSSFRPADYLRSGQKP